MNKEELSPELEKIFNEYSTYFWNTLCECRECDIKEAVEIFRDALVDVDKIIKEKNNANNQDVLQLLPSPEAKAESKAAKQEQIALECDFDFFWKIYPRHVSKKDALKAYIKARKKASANELLEALREVKSKEWKSKELQYIPHASTWLNQERWTDEVTEAKKIDPLDDLDLDSNPFEVQQ